MPVKDIRPIKSQLRDKYKQMRRDLSLEEKAEKDACIAARVFRLWQYRENDVLLTYVSTNIEVDTHQIILRALADGKKVAVPKCYGDDMRFIYMDDLSKVEKNDMGIPEPTADEPVANDETALVLMPGLAFDEAGHRIGYGGGFYDKFLVAEPNHPTVALCYDFQMFAHLDTEEFDIPVDLVLWA